MGEREAGEEQVSVTEVRTVTSVVDDYLQTGAGNVAGTSTIYETSDIPTPTPDAAINEEEDVEVGIDANSESEAAQESFAKRQNVVYVTKTMGQASGASPAPNFPQNSGSQAASMGETTKAESPASGGSKDDSVADTPKSSTGGSKRGLSYEPNDVALLKAFAGSKASWVYNWGSSTKEGVPSGMEFVPMLWGNDPAKYANNWPEQAKKAKASGSKHFLSFNEPDHKEQANLSPDAAAQSHIKFMNPLSSGDIKIGGPAITNGEAEKGMGPTGWLKPFLEKCGGQCKIDFQPIHWYDSFENMAYFKKFLKEAHDVAKKPLWLTEFAASGTPEQQAKFMSEALPYLDGLDYVERYAYFMVKDGKMMSGTTPNAAGKAYMQ